MLLSLLGFWMLLTPLAAEANTQVIFNREGNQATVMLMGMPGDSDPVGFWEALKIPPEDFQGKLSKRLAVPAGPSGVRSFDAACVFSKVIGNSGTCTLILRDADGIGKVDRANGRARVMLTGELAAQVAEAFVLPDASNFMYRTRDGRMQISFVREEGVVSWLVIDWNGKGIM